MLRPGTGGRAQSAPATRRLPAVRLRLAVAALFLVTALLASPALRSGRASATSVTPMIAVGAAHACALDAAGAVRCWGRNAEGQLGDGTTVRSIGATG